MSFAAPKERPPVHRDAPECSPAPSAHEIKYRHDAAHYVASMLTELRQIAGKAGFHKLVSTLDAAYYDAYAAMGSHDKPAAADPREKSSEPLEPTTT